MSLRFLFAILLLPCAAVQAASVSLNATESLSIPGFIPHVVLSDDSRSVFSIVWSCVATLFTCAWVAVHPDMPGLDDGATDHLFNRVKLLIWVIISPEAVLVWAIRQHRGAQALRYRFNNTDDNQISSKHWNLRHAHFLQMGGFVICPNKEDDSFNFIASPDLLMKLSKEGIIDFPKEVKAYDIRNRSSSDGLTYFITILQLAWFVTQCIARTVVGLSVTLFELVAASFVPITIIMYIAWWKKPQNAQAPIIIYVNPGKSLPDIGKPTVRENSVTCFPMSLIEGAVTTFEDMLGSTDRSQTIQHYSRDIPPFYAYPHEHNPAEIPETPLWVGSILGSVFGIIHIIGWTFSFRSRLEKILWRSSSALIIVVPLLTVANIFLARKCLHPKAKKASANRDSGVSMASSQATTNKKGVAGESQVGNEATGANKRPWLHMLQRACFGTSAVLLAISYIIARVVLLGVMCSSLRSLPAKELQGVNWVTDLPHLL